MNSLYLLIPIAVVLVLVALRLFFWAVKTGQYDDLNTEGHRILFDDDDRLPAKPKARAEDVIGQPKSEAKPCKD